MLLPQCEPQAPDYELDGRRMIVGRSVVGLGRDVGAVASLEVLRASSWTICRLILKVLKCVPLQLKS